MGRSLSIYSVSSPPQELYEGQQEQSDISKQQGNEERRWVAPAEKRTLFTFGQPVMEIGGRPRARRGGQ